MITILVAAARLAHESPLRRRDSWRPREGWAASFHIFSTSFTGGAFSIVTDAKIVVDRYLTDAKDDAAREPIDKAMRYYTLASMAWHARVAPFGSVDFKPLAADPIVKECQASAAMLEKERGTQRTPGAHADGVTLAFNVPVLWMCASDKIAEAEKLGGAK